MCASQAKPQVARAEFQSEYKGTKRPLLKANGGCRDSLDVTLSGYAEVQDWFNVLHDVPDVCLFPSNKTMTLLLETSRSSSLMSSIKQIQESDSYLLLICLKGFYAEEIKLGLYL